MAPASPIAAEAESIGPLPVLAPADLSQQPLPSAAGLNEALLKPLSARALGGSGQYSVYDPATGRELAGVASGRGATPASTTKILTAVAVLGAYGADSRLATTVTQPEPGRLVLVGGGDPLLLVDQAKGSGRASLSELARRTAAALRASQPSGSPRVRVSYDDSLFTGPTRAPAWEPAYTNAATALVPPITALMANRGFIGGDVDNVPAVEATRAFAAKLAAAGVDVKGKITKTRERQPVPQPGGAGAASPGGAVPSGAPPVAQVFSPPLSEVVGTMLRQSDNVTAEVLGHLAGGRISGAYSFAGGATATLQVLGALGVQTTGVSLGDASGLSRSNLIPPLTISQALSAAIRNQTPALWPTVAGLAVAGFDGTLADRFEAGSARSARGYVRAKTGTLTGVSALAGTVTTRSGATLVFAFVAPKATDTFAAAAAWDRAAAALAACGCDSRPAASP